MNKADLIERVSKNLGSSKAETERYLTEFLNGITEGLQRDRTVQLVGFGTFNVKQRKARVGRNPQTKQEIHIPASTTVGFKVGKALKNAV